MHILLKSGVYKSSVKPNQWSAIHETNVQGKIGRAELEMRGRRALQKVKYEVHCQCWASDRFMRASEKTC